LLLLKAVSTHLLGGLGATANGFTVRLRYLIYEVARLVRLDSL